MENKYKSAVDAASTLSRQLDIQAEQNVGRRIGHMPKLKMDSVKAAAEEIVKKGRIKQNVPYTYEAQSYMSAKDMVVAIIKKHLNEN